MTDVAENLDHLQTGSGGDLVDMLEPIRFDFSKGEGLFQSAAELGTLNLVSLPAFAGFSYKQRLASNQSAIRQNYASISKAAQQDALITPSAEWLLDNHHIVDENFRHLKRDLSDKFYHQLPMVDVAGNGAIPRTMAIVWYYIAFCNSEISIEGLTNCVAGFQQAAPLKIGELWSVPSLLRYVLLENLRRLSDRVEGSRKRRTAANETADMIVKLKGGMALEEYLSTQSVHIAEDTFSAQLLYRLHYGNISIPAALDWLNSELEKRGSSPDSAVQSEHNRQSSSNVTTGNIIHSLKLCDKFDWLKWFETVSSVDRILSDGSDFMETDKQTRNEYRNTVERIARHSRFHEVEVAAKAIALSRASEHIGSLVHVGEFLVGKDLHTLETACGYRPKWKEKILRVYRKLGWLGVFLPALFMSILFALMAASLLPKHGLDPLFVAFLAILFFFPASEAATGLVNFLSSRLLKPAKIAGYDFLDGIPETSHTLVVIPCMITSFDVIDDLVENLELHYLSNPKGSVSFALATDWRDSPTETVPEDAALLNYATAKIARLSVRYSHSGAERFFLFHRRRLFNQQEGVWMGWERKRGKLAELNTFLRGDQQTSFFNGVPVPATKIRYIMTLDSDTRLPRDSVPGLVGKMAHPVNHPVFDPATHTIVSGYGLMQPRVTPSLTTGVEASIFQRVFSVNRGMDPYVFAVSDLYQDLLGEGSFTGKGLYDLDCFETALRAKIPENEVLSHDLLEGSWCRTALVTDVQFVEDFPVLYSVDVARQHRWVRGDWQLLPFIIDLNNGLNATARLKMIDNLRRSAVPIAWVLASFLGWLVLSPGYAVTWQCALVASLIITPFMNFNARLMPTQPGVSLWRHFRTLLHEAANHAFETGLRLVFMAHHASSMLDAIIRTFYRLLVSHKNMLEWRSAQQVHTDAKSGLWSYFRAMNISPLLGSMLLLLVFLINSSSLLVALPFSLLWMAAPAFAWYVSRTLETEDRLQISERDAGYLRAVARETWRFFETFVNDEQHNLPPDNFQELPQAKIANRTSPTNIGLYLLTVLSARDFGWISFSDTLTRIDKTLKTLEVMEKYRGHLFNWYDTATLAVLNPRYVSAVDSGNLAGHLIVLSSALKDWALNPSVHMLGNLSGIGDTFAIARQRLNSISDNRRTLRPLRRRLEQRFDGFEQTYRHYWQAPQTAPMRASGLAVIAEDICKLARDYYAEDLNPEALDLVWWADALLTNCQASVFDSTSDHDDITVLRQRLDAMAERARILAFDMDFGCLYNPEFGLLHIGYRESEQKLDESCYDLLASEARLASFFAIAKGDLVNEHWFRLGRLVTPVGSSGALLSWTGSMFEYLMPTLVMHEPLGGILNQSNGAAVACQIEFGNFLKIPWGVSESAFNARDREMNYQYHSFGVQALGLKRNLAEDVVIAPYATALASQYRPKEAVINLSRLEKVGAKGKFGFYDAVDYTRSRLPEGEDFAVVCNYMAHHQGMAIVAIANAVLEGIHRQRFHADPVIKAAELLLQEKAPREIVPVTRPMESGDRNTSANDFENTNQTLIFDPTLKPRQICLLSNGRFTAMLTSTGSGYSRYDGMAVSRWRADPTLDDYGTHLFLRDCVSGARWSATPERRPSAPETSHVIFNDHKAEYSKLTNGIETRLECIIASEANAEGRRLTIENRSLRERVIEITSYGEIVLTIDAADIAHPAFSNMFVHTEFNHECGAIIAHRNARAEGERTLHFAHLFADSGNLLDLHAETDRRAFIGAGRSLANPAIFDPNFMFETTDNFTLDPIYSLRRTFRIPAGKIVKLTIWNIVTDDADSLHNAVAHYRRSDIFDHESKLAWTHSQVQLRHVGSSLADTVLYRRFASYLVYPDTALSAKDPDLKGSMLPQSALWQFGISGDNPVFLVRIDNEADLPIIQDIVQMHEYFRNHGLTVDFVILNERGSSYTQELQNGISVLVDMSARRLQLTGSKLQVFALRKDLIGASATKNLLSLARIVVHTRHGKLSEQLARFELEAAAQDRLNKTRDIGSARGDLVRPMSSHFMGHRSANLPLLDFPEEALENFNGYGGFAPDAAEYVVRLRHGETTPQPWINVIANERFGFHVSADGAGFTWAENSRDFQISPWSNDPVINRPGEGIYIRDSDSDRVATPFSTLSNDPNAIFEARHGLGYSRFRSWSRWLDVDAVQTLSADGLSKLTKITLTNRTNATLRLVAAGYVEWVLGNNRAASGASTRTFFDKAVGGITAVNPFSIQFASQRVTFAVDRPIAWWTTSRLAFLGADGSYRAPESILDDPETVGNSDTGGDPCAAIATDIELEAGESKTIMFSLSVSDAHISNPFAPPASNATFSDATKQTKKVWEEFLGTIQVTTPDPDFDRMINTWLPYQALSCRVFARTGFYQASGAYGFRDQLQDTSAFIWQDPKLAKAQILNAAARQFLEGDVQHWWLPVSNAGVRTKISDDVVWLAHSVARYISMTGDHSILDTPIAYLNGQVLQPGESDAFFIPQITENIAPLYDHCVLALNLAIERTSARGLPLILGGDWNDGMNRVGAGGHGDSVWLGWFLAGTLQAFAPIAARRGDDDHADRWEKCRQSLLIALETVGWDGKWYQRGSFDDGTPLGASVNDECRIDSIAQSWAVISGQGHKDRQLTAMDEVVKQLVDPHAKLVRLFTPPFEKSTHNPGYIMSYPSGVRENGGQYTHAATWVVYALALLGQGDEAFNCFKMLNPIAHTQTRHEADRYRTEPYVVAADIYSGPEKSGRGGWTWYTGSAGWLYRAGVEGILGLSLSDGNALLVKPAIPSHWRGYNAKIKILGVVRDLLVKRNGARFTITLDGLEADSDGRFALKSTMQSG